MASSADKLRDQVASYHGMKTEQDRRAKTRQQAADAGGTFTAEDEAKSHREAQEYLDEERRRKAGSDRSRRTGGAGTPASTRSSSQSSKAKKAAKKVRRVATRHVPTAAGTATNLWHFAVVCLMMVALYVALTHASGVGSVVAGLQKAVAWLVSPTATI